ncbi:hypothetical protein CspeluHIS016_0205450 [Cutaneotrichosporon spelunceum]|uniref:Uncharacterized protein n=1 Tax=Cutaneotrichosporon spelunceum TaxID=1672016 RepID=A0AAD3TRV8_9TREE|nr:hypothetical protein CspeluHIS016_0205450 [Cutaneotrichosporon spelunceum]
MMHPSEPTRDPNFPAWLDIQPLHLANTAAAEGADAHAQAAAIGRYGIAGRVWEASGPLVEYLTPRGSQIFDPPCSLFSPGPHRVLELGSGQALASLHLAACLSPADTVVLTDLPNVMPLCQSSIDTWARSGEGKNGGARVVARALAWGEKAELDEFRPFTHILMCDLVYFPHLYPPLLRTLLEVTEPDEMPHTDVFGPEIILAWKSRSLALEESFFDSFARYFRMEPVMGPVGDVKLFLCRRWRVTEEWQLPDLSRVMNGAPGVVVGRSFGLAESLFAEMEWD